MAIKQTQIETAFCKDMKFLRVSNKKKERPFHVKEDLLMATMSNMHAVLSEDRDI